MEQKRAMTSVDLAALVGELRRYEGAKVDKAYLYDDDLVRLKMRDFDRGRVELLIEVGDPKRAHVSSPERVPDAPGRPPNFAMMLRNRLSGADFVGVEQYGFDRILTFSFRREDGNTEIVAELFGEGNVAVLDGNGTVVSSLDTVRLKSRTVAPGSQYEYPDARFDPMTAGFDAFVARMEQSDTDVVRTLATQLNFGGLWAEELCTRAGVEKTLDIEDAEESTYRRIFEVIGELTTRLKEGNLDPRVYFESEPAEDGDADRTGTDAPSTPVDATPVPLAEYEGSEVEAYDSFNEALDYYFASLEVDEPSREEARGRPDFEEEIAKYERIIAQQEGAIGDFDERADAEREKAELLYGHYDLVDEVVRTVRAAREEGRPWDDIEETLRAGAEQGIPAAEAVAGVDAAEGTVRLSLEGRRVTIDPRHGVEKNANRIYNEAKRIGEKKEGALEAIEDTREKLAAAERRRDEWERSTADEAEETEAEGEAVDWLSRSSIPVRYDDQWFERFRWFRTSDGFLVIGGRNASQNEELVKKYLDRQDLFFHTQAHGAPVTILKATGPSEAARDVDIPESSREEAAQFAVSYSSVWKDGRFAGDVYMVTAEQVSKTPESGEFLEKGSFAVRGERTYYDNTPVGVAVGIACEPETRVVGGPPSAVDGAATTSISLEPGQYAQNDIAKLLYREFKERFTDQTFVRKVASPDRIQEFCPPGGSRVVE